MSGMPVYDVNVPWLRVALAPAPDFMRLQFLDKSHMGGPVGNNWGVRAGYDKPLGTFYFAIDDMPGCSVGTTPKELESMQALEKAVVKMFQVLDWRVTGVTLPTSVILALHAMRKDAFTDSALLLD